MKFIYSFSKAIGLCSLLLMLIVSEKSFGQDCSSGQPSSTTCSNNISENFNSSNGGFTGQAVNPSGAGSPFTYNGNSFSTEVNITTGEFPILSPVYIKGSTNPNTVIGGFNLTAGSKVTVTNVKLEIIRNSDNAVLATCNQTTSLNNSSATYCISITDNDITQGLEFRYRFTFTLVGQNGNRLVTFDNFSQGGIENIVLPVKLSSFTAMRDNNHVKLQWSTASESNNKGFEIERKLNGASAFETIAFIASLSKTGNSDVKLDYDFTDINMSATATQYRLKQIDLDGKIVYSDIRTADGIRENASVMIYPNPSKNGNTNLVFGANGSRTIRVMDISGRSVMQYNNYRNAQLLIDGLKKGSYIITVLDHANNQQETLRLVIAQ